MTFMHTFLLSAPNSQQRINRILKSRQGKPWRLFNCLGTSGQSVGRALERASTALFLACHLAQRLICAAIGTGRTMA